ncbi:ATP-binding protein [Actinoplanes sp. CA-015351]|uniref:ATP-binding protein n=1 Tax=Actinoplanes sp. CA-015351 TaxID=3239897 RepID=UPI003D967FA8
MTALPASVPPKGAVELGSWMIEDYHGLRIIRAELRRAVGELGLVGVSAGPCTSGSGSSAGRPSADDDDDDVAERIAVVATELATNALRHGRPPALVRLLRVTGLLIVDVSDHDPERAPRFDVERPLGQGGLGMLLARTFAVEVGWYRAGAGKHVWASFPA